MKYLVCGLTCLLYCSVALAQAAVVYVDTNLDPPCTVACGGSWATAFDDLPAAITHATTTSADEVWVADGLYNGGFALSNNLKIIGGFAGGETSASQALPHVNLAYINGNSSLAVTSQNNDASAVLQGFYVFNGSADYTQMGAGA